MLDPLVSKRGDEVIKVQSEVFRDGFDDVAPANLFCERLCGDAMNARFPEPHLGIDDNGRVLALGPQPDGKPIRVGKLHPLQKQLRRMSQEHHAAGGFNARPQLWRKRCTLLSDDEQATVGTHPGSGVRERIRNAELLPEIGDECPKPPQLDPDASVGTREGSAPRRALPT
jgi:hypothetical protein